MCRLLSCTCSRCVQASARCSAGTGSAGTGSAATLRGYHCNRLQGLTFTQLAVPTNFIATTQLCTATTQLCQANAGTAILCATQGGAGPGAVHSLSEGQPQLPDSALFALPPVCWMSTAAHIHMPLLPSLQDQSIRPSGCFDQHLKVRSVMTSVWLLHHVQRTFSVQ